MKPLVSLSVLLYLCFNVLFSFSNQSYQQQVDSLELYYEYLLKADSTAKAGSILHDISNMHQFEGNWTAYDETVDRMFDFARKNKNKQYEAESLNKVAISSCLNGNNQKAIIYFNKCLNIYLDLKDSVGIGNSFENLGLVHKDMGEYKTALDYQMKALDIRLKINSKRIPENYSNISQIYDFIGDKEKQRFYLNQAFIAAGKFPPADSRSAILCCEMGEYLMDVGIYDSAMVFFEKGLIHCENIDWKKGIAVFLANIAQVNALSGDFEKAIGDRKKVLELSYEINDCMGIAQELNAITNLYLDIDKLDSALLYNQIAIDKANECTLRKQLTEAYLLASNIFENQGNATDALKSYKLYHQLNDSVFSLEKKKAIDEIATKYQAEQKQNQINQLQADNKIKNQRINLSIAIITGLALIIALIFYVLLHRRKQAIYRQLSLDQKLLRSQMNPHFIFNALGSIQHFMFNNESQRASFYLGSFSKLMRSVLINSAKELVTVEEEIQVLSNYLTLEQMRTRNAFEFEINVDENIDQELLKIPPMILQPFVENAVKHGVKKLQTGGGIKVDFCIHHNNLKLSVSDNGCGINEAKLMNAKRSHQSVAMNIFSVRIRIFEKQYKTKLQYSIIDKSDINSTENGTEISILFPILE